MLIFKNKLFRLGIKILNDADEAADAVQEVYLKLWNMRDKLHTYNSKEALAMAMVKNHCLDQLKAQHNKVRKLGKSTIEIADYNSAQRLDLFDTTPLIEQLIRQLPMQQKLVMHLRDIEQYEFDEIADLTGQSLNAVRANLSRARKQVREQLIQHNNYEYKTH